ncbi:MAG TPA: DUF1490 family protein [Mycobacterium sp.]|nr:DUF1490 family protein [Mycobacterium sp.]
MVLHGIVAKAATTVVTGAVGVAAYDLLKKAVAKVPVREASVTAAEWALRGTRKAEETAESARLSIADVMAEARERVGEEVPPPAVADSEHAHEH